MVNYLLDYILHKNLLFNNHLFLNNFLDLRVNFNRYLHRDEDFLIDNHLSFNNLLHFFLYHNWHFNWNKHFFYDCFFNYDRLIVQLNWYLHRKEDLFFDYPLHNNYLLYFYRHFHQDLIRFVRGLACQPLIVLLLSLLVDLRVNEIIFLQNLIRNIRFFNFHVLLLIVIDIL